MTLKTAAPKSDCDSRLEERSQEAKKNLLDLRFRSLLTNTDWRRLPEATRQRFSKRVSDGKTIVYVGHVTRAHINGYGRFLANVLRLVGAPLPISEDVNVPSVVAVTEDVKTSGQIWTRLYANNRKFPQVIHSAKRFCGPTGLEEYIGFGISMALTVRVVDGALTFCSSDYFLGIGNWRLKLPGFLHPASLTVKHTDQGEGRFEFELILEHGVFGTLLHQAGLYREERNW